MTMTSPTWLRARTLRARSSKLASSGRRARMCGGSERSLQDGAGEHNRGLSHKIATFHYHRFNWSMRTMGSGLRIA